MKKRIWMYPALAFLMLVLAGISMPQVQPVHADSAPQPKLTIEILGMENVATYYVAPLATYHSSMPGPDNPTHPWTAIDTALNSYDDPDGYYYTAYFYNTCHGNTFVTFGFSSFDPFKVLIYEPVSGAYAVSQAKHELPRLHSYFVYELDGDAFATAAPGAVLPANVRLMTGPYHIREQIVALLVRMLITLVLEIGLAWLLGYRYWRQLTDIGLANIVTQVLLNVWLNLLYMRGGNVLYYMGLFFGEALVTAIEAIFYTLFFKYRAKKNPRYMPRGMTAYAIAANMLSAIAGLVLSWFFTYGIFRIQ